MSLWEHHDYHTGENRAVKLTFVALGIELMPFNDPVGQLRNL